MNNVLKSIGLSAGFGFLALVGILTLSSVDLTNFEINANLIDSIHAKYQDCFTDKDDVVIVETHINTDGIKDALITYTSESECGTGGCIHELCISQEGKNYAQANFGLAANSVEVLQTVTSGMHDLKLNDNEDLKMIWNGEKFELDAN